MGLDEVLITRAIIERYVEKLLANLDLDVAVAGAGPAGLTAAWRLARKGWKVALFERQGSIGGGLWGGGMMLNEIVIQEEARSLLDELGIRLRPIYEDYYSADAMEAATTLGVQALKAGAVIFNLFSAADVLVREHQVTGLALSRTATESALPAPEPLVVRSRCVVDATGRGMEVIKLLVQKNQPMSLFTPTGGIGGERSLWAEAGEREIVDQTREIYPGLFVAGRAAAAASGAHRSGPIFGGLFLSGAKVAALIHERLGSQ